MKPWRVGFSLLGMVLALCFCLPVIVRETKGGRLNYTNKRLLIQLAVVLGDVALGVLNMLLCLFRSEWLAITCLVLLSLALIPTLATVGFAAVPVFSSWCCCFGRDMCLVADDSLLLLAGEACRECEAWEFMSKDYTLMFVGMAGLAVSLVFLIATTCFWRSGFVKEENEAQFFLERNQRMASARYKRQADLATIVP